MFLCSGFSSWNLRSPVAFPSLSKIFAVYPRLSKGFLESEGRGQEAKLCSRLFDQGETRLSCLFHAEPQEGTATIILRIAKKTAEAAVRLEKGFEAPMGKRGGGKTVPGPSRLVILYGLAPSCLRRFVVSR